MSCTTLACAYNFYPFLVQMYRIYSGGSRISRRGGRGPCTGGRGPLRRLRFENFACQNERIWTRRGGGGARRARPPPRSANDLYRIYIYFINKYLFLFYFNYKLFNILVYILKENGIRRDSP